MAFILNNYIWTLSLYRRKDIFHQFEFAWTLFFRSSLCFVIGKVIFSITLYRMLQFGLLGWPTSLVTASGPCPFISERISFISLSSLEPYYFKAAFALLIGFASLCWSIHDAFNIAFIWSILQVFLSDYSIFLGLISFILLLLTFYRLLHLIQIQNFITSRRLLSFSLSTDSVMAAKSMRALSMSAFGEASHVSGNSSLTIFKCRSRWFRDVSVFSFSYPFLKSSHVLKPRVNDCLF